MNEELDLIINWITGESDVFLPQFCTGKQIKKLNDIRRLYTTGKDSKIKLYIEAIENIPLPLFIKDENLNLVFFNSSYSHLKHQYQKKNIDLVKCSCEIELNLFKLASGAVTRALKLDNIDVGYWGCHLILKDGSSNPHSYIIGMLNTFTNEEQLKLDIEFLQLQLEKYSLSDEVTGIGNRNSSFSHLDTFISNHIRYDENFSVLLLKIDNLSEISEKMGYTESNFILVSIAQKFKTSLRNGDVATRFDDNEFLLLIKDQVPSNVGFVANRLHREIQSICKEINAQLDLHIGCASHKLGEDRDSLIERARRNMDNPIPKKSHEFFESEE